MAKFPAIPPPGGSVESLVNTVTALKGAVEQLIGVRGGPDTTAILHPIKKKKVAGVHSLASFAPVTRAEFDAALQRIAALETRP